MSNGTGIHTWNPYPAYKDSGVEWLGQVPEGWQVISLRRLIHVKSGDMTSASEFIDEGYQVFGGNGFRGFIDKWNTLEGTIIIGRYGALCGNIKVAPCNLWATEHAFRVLPFLEFNTSFMAYLLEDLNLNRLSARAAQPGLNSELVRNHTVGMPNIFEQQIIAAFLDRECGHIDALIEKKRRLLELLEEKRRAVITQAVTRGLDPHAPMKDSGVEWLGQVPEGWETWKLTHAFASIGSGTTPKSDNSAYYGGDISWVTTSELRECSITETNAHITIEALISHSALKIYPKGTLLIAMYGATIGRMGLLEIEATCNQACCAITGELTLFTNFLFYWLQGMRNVLVSFASGGGQPNLSQEFIKSLVIPAPSLSEQQAIAAYLDATTAAIDAQRQAHEKSIALLQEYRASLITHAVTGKIDVRHYAPQQ